MVEEKKKRHWYDCFWGTCCNCFCNNCCNDCCCEDCGENCFNECEPCRTNCPSCWGCFTNWFVDNDAISAESTTATITSSSSAPCNAVVIVACGFALILSISLFTIYAKNQEFEVWKRALLICFGSMGTTAAFGLTFSAWRWCRGYRADDRDACVGAIC